jgi:hypothetical protein
MRVEPREVVVSGKSPRIAKEWMVYGTQGRFQVVGLVIATSVTDHHF